MRSPRRPTMVALLLAAQAVFVPRALAQDLEYDPGRRSGLLLVAGLDLGTYGVGSGLTGPSLAAKLGLGFRHEGLGVALVGEADYGVVNLPLQESTGNYWVLPQLDVAFLGERLRVHAFAGAGWGRFQDVDAGGQHEVVFYGGGVGFGWDWFEITLRYLAPKGSLEAAGARASTSPRSVPGIGTQLTIGMRWDLVI